MVLDNFLDLKFLSKTVLRKKLKISRAKKDFLVCFHPETIGNENNLETLNNLIMKMKEYKDYNFIFTASNPWSELFFFNEYQASATERMWRTQSTKANMSRFLDSSLASNTPPQISQCSDAASYLTR